ncbi:hypothetical protein GRI62_03205 [Erythrobacter arachoides]|uniref:Lipoprotein n=1 Tax=Aurantiacibacter arachoides TaxID=1850444 RepID=A0A844ZWX3_9SPHN|nr:hypothetical protein [Aurantiacibacter arachoides]MXO92613.1 hypothetical protein [Aurantiacibacter arachoides]GGD55783.1 hypothetical protein GCM10011411_14740 [Aurantiacibacter arachoides]
MERKGNVTGALAALLLVAAPLLAGCAHIAPQVAVPAELLARHDFSLADTPNKRTALAYLYTAWNDGQLAQARQSYWVPGSFPPGGGAGPPVSPRYTIRRVIEEGDQVVVLAFVEGVGIGQPFTTIFGTPGGTKIGDAVVEIMRFDPATGLIAEKVDVIEPLSETTYDFR